MAITRIGPNQSVNLASNVTGTLPTANGGTGATSFSPGKVLQVINATSTAETVLTDSSTADTGLTANITPASTSNKVLVFDKALSYHKQQTCVQLCNFWVVLKDRQRH